MILTSSQSSSVSLTACVVLRRLKWPSCHVDVFMSASGQRYLFWSGPPIAFLCSAMPSFCFSLMLASSLCSFWFISSQANSSQFSFLFLGLHFLLSHLSVRYPLSLLPQTEMKLLWSLFNKLHVADLLASCVSLCLCACPCITSLCVCVKLLQISVAEQWSV